MNPTFQLIVATALIGAPSAVCLLFPSIAIAQSSIEGRWLVPDSGSTIEVVVSGGTLTGTLIASEDSRAPIGTRILRNFTQQGDMWVGKVFVPRRRKSFDAELRLEGDKLVVRVFSGMGSKVKTWTRSK